MIALCQITVAIVLINNISTEGFILPRSGTALYTERLPTMHDVPPNSSYKRRGNGPSMSPTHVASHSNKATETYKPTAIHEKAYKASEATANSSSTSLHNMPSTPLPQSSVQEDEHKIENKKAEQQNISSKPDVCLQTDVFKPQCYSEHEDKPALQNPVIQKHTPLPKIDASMPPLKQNNNIHFRNQLSNLYNPICLPDEHVSENTITEQSKTASENTITEQSRTIHDPVNQPELDTPSTDSGESISTFVQMANILGDNVNTALLTIFIAAMVTLSLYLVVMHKRVILEATGSFLESRFPRSHHMLSCICSKALGVVGSGIQIIRSVCLKACMKVFPIWSTNIKTVPRRGLRRGIVYREEFK